jgi:hypothetical protein
MYKSSVKGSTAMQDDGVCAPIHLSQHQHGGRRQGLKRMTIFAHVGTGPAIFALSPANVGAN